MGITKHLAYARHYLQENMPYYLFGYGGCILVCIGLIWISILQNWYSFVIIAIAVMFLLSYFLVASLWAASHVYNVTWLRDTLFNIANIQSEDTIILISLGRRYIPASFCRRLTTGKVLVFDVYNPQLTQSKALARARRLSKFLSDPRIIWRDVINDILPLPDNSQSFITLVHVASEFGQSGDQLQLFTEIFRVLKPGGQMLIAEGLQSSTSIFTSGISAIRFKSDAYWETMISQSGFKLTKKVNLKDLVCCWGFEKPLAPIPDQLVLDI